MAKNATLIIKLLDFKHIIDIERYISNIMQEWLFSSILLNQLLSWNLSVFTLLSTFPRLTTSFEQNNDSLQNFPTLGTRKCELKKIDESESVSLQQWNWASVNWKCCKERKSEIVILQLNFAEWNVGWCFVCAAPPFLITFPTTACTFEVRIAGDDNASRGLFHKRERALFQGFQQG